MGLPMAAVGGLGFQIGRGIPIGKGEDEVVWAGGGGRLCVGPDWIGVCLGKRSFQVPPVSPKFDFRPSSEKLGICRPSTIYTVHFLSLAGFDDGFR
jgi:hypothetical protein